MGRYHSIQLYTADGTYKVEKPKIVSQISRGPIWKYPWRLISLQDSSLLNRLPGPYS